MSRGIHQVAGPQHATSHPVGKQHTLALPGVSLLQTKLRIGAPDDAFEREADRMADAVMRMPGPDSGPSAVHRSPAEQLQRMCPECEEEEEQKLRRKPRSENGSRTGDPVRDGLRGYGQALPDSTRAFFQPRFGYDFSQVRVHTDETAVRAARSIGARAFTLGRHIAFDAGEFAPDTNAGRHLLAHELTHVAQQTAAPAVVMRKATDPECAKTAKTQAKENVESGPSTAHCAAENVKENEIEGRLVLDQITVAVVGPEDCEQCNDLTTKLVEHCRSAWGRKPAAGAERDLEAERKFRLQILRVGTSGAAKNPVTRIYLDRELMDDGATLDTAPPVLTRLSEIASSAVKPDWPLGLLIGGGIGLGAGIGAGIGVGAALEAGGMALGTAAGFGVLAGAGIFGAGLALGAIIGVLLDELQGEALDDARRQEVLEYLCMIGKHGPLGETSLARDAVTLWGERGFTPNDALFPVAIRRKVVRDLVDGATEDREERAIIKILEHSANHEIMDLLDPDAPAADRVTMQDLDQNIEGSESRYALKLLERRFPKLGERPGDTDIKRTGKPGELLCDARQAIMITFAHARAESMARTARDRLNAYLDDPKSEPLVEAALARYFRGATTAQVGQIRDVFSKTFELVPTREYICPGTQEVELPDPDLETLKHQCHTSLFAFVARDQKYPRVFACPAFFEFGPDDQAVTFLHEWTHQAAKLPTERETEGLPLEVALDNAESYAVLAFLIHFSKVFSGRR